MKDKVEIKYVSDDSGYWELTVNSKLLGQKVIKLDNNNAMVIDLAIATVRNIGVKEGQEKAMKKYQAIENASDLDVTWRSERPWDDAHIPTHWNPEWNLDDSNK